MPAALSKVLVDKEHWLRLSVFQHEPLKQAVLYIFHDERYGGLPRDPQKLFEELERNHKSKLRKLQKDKILKDKQMLLIFPSNKETDSTKFDITLVVVLIKNCLTLTPPTKGWKCPNPPASDQSIAATIVRATVWRNFLHHTEPHHIDIHKFEQHWQAGVDIITALGYVYDTEALKKSVLDPARFSVLQSLVSYLESRQTELKTAMEENSGSILKLNLLFNRTDNLNEEILSLNETVTSHAKSLDEIKTKMNLILEVHELASSKIKEHKHMFQDSAEFAQNEFQTVHDDTNFDKMVLPDVLERVSRYIGPKWESLSRRLGVSGEFIEEIGVESELDDKEKMRCCFKWLENMVDWQTLKSSLQFLNHEDIVDHLRSYSFLTHGLRKAYMELQKIYLDELFNWLFVQPFLGHDGLVCEMLPREEGYVDLAIISASEVDKYWSISDREFHLQQRHFERTSIKLNDLVKGDDAFVLVRGIAGIGKSTLVDTFVLRWAQGLVLTGVGDSPKIDFLFKFTCRELNTFEDISSSEQMLRLKYDHVFRCIDIGDLEELAHRTLILLDGLDELKSIHTLRGHIAIKDPLVRAVFGLINPKGNILKGHKTFVAGRPEACSIVRSAMQRQVTLKTVEVCGFNPQNVELYIDRFFRQNPDSAAKVKEKLVESDNLSAMATIPVYLWVICGVFKEDMNIESPKTITHLSSFACLIFLRNHLKQLPTNYQDKTLRELCSNDHIIVIIACLIELSQLTMKDRKVVFPESTVTSLDSPIQLEHSGFLVKHVYGERGAFYQFRHLVLQEYFTALNLYLCSESIVSDIKLPCFKSCFPVVAGLSGIEMSVNERDFIKDLIVNLRKYKRKYRKASDVARTDDIPNYIMQCLVDRLSDENCLKIDKTFTDVLASFYEYRGDFSNLPEISCVDIKGINHHHDIRNLLYLVHNLRIEKVRNVSIINTGNKPLAENFWELLRMYLHGTDQVRTWNKELHFHGKSEMTLRTQTVTEPTCTKTLLVTLYKDIKKHKAFLVSIIPLVDKIILHATLDSLYALVKEMLVEHSLEAFHRKVLYDSDLKEAFNSVAVPPNTHQMTMLADMVEVCAANDSEFPFSSLQLVGIDVLDEHIEVLEPVIARLKVFNIGWNGNMSPESMLSISRSLNTSFVRHQTTWLKDLILVNCSLTDDHIIALSVTITYVSYLDISWNQNLSALAMARISKAVMSRKVLARLSIKMSNCRLTDHHVHMFYPCVCHLDTVDLSMNESFSPAAMQMLSSALQTDSRFLKTLDLRCCSLTDAHIYRLSALARLQNLYLDGNVRLTLLAIRAISNVILQHVRAGKRLDFRFLSLKYASLTTVHKDQLIPILHLIDVRL